MHFRRLALVAALLALPVLVAATEITGIVNFHKVNDRLYRGAQPDDDAFAELAKLGVTTVLDLRTTWEHSTEDEARLVEAAGMRYVNVPMRGFFKTPSSEKLAAARAVIDTGGVVFVHCKQGRDRTGTVIALYRIEREGWTNEKAYAEAKDLGIQWFSGGMKKLIKHHQPETALAQAASSDSSKVITLSATPDTIRAIAAPALQDSVAPAN